MAHPRVRQSPRLHEGTEYIDQASAAYLGLQTAWDRLLEDARPRPVDRVMVWKLERAYRSTLHALRTLEALDAWGVGFACRTQELDTTSPTGPLVFTVLAEVAEMERSLIADRVREGMAHARRQGIQSGRPRVEGSRGFRPGWAEVESQVRARTLSRRASPPNSGSDRGPSLAILAVGPTGSCHTGNAGKERAESGRATRGPAGADRTPHHREIRVAPVGPSPCRPWRSRCASAQGRQLR